VIHPQSSVFNLDQVVQGQVQSAAGALAVVDNDPLPEADLGQAAG
jgi:hypothetical protein